VSVYTQLPDGTPVSVQIVVATTPEHDDPTVASSPLAVS
jgi:hypothetical protein